MINLQESYLNFNFVFLGINIYLNNYPIVVKNPVLITSPNTGLLFNYLIDLIVVPENKVQFLSF